MMSGLQGAFFRPLSIAFLLAVGLSLLVAMSATPALCALVMRRHRPHAEAPFLRAPASAGSCARSSGSIRARAWSGPSCSLSGVAGIVLLPLLGARLLPDFRENYLIAHASLRPAFRSPKPRASANASRRALVEIPGVKSVAEQIGRAENGQDPDAPNKSEFEVQIDPRHGRSAAEIDAAIRDVFDDYPNQLVEIYSVLAERIGETLSGESAPFFDQRDRLRSRYSTIASPRRSSTVLRANCRTAATCAWSCRRGSRSCSVRAARRSSSPSTACRPPMCWRRSTRPITAAASRRSARRIAACRSRAHRRRGLPIRTRSARCCCAGATARWCRLGDGRRSRNRRRRAA